MMKKFTLSMAALLLTAVVLFAQDPQVPDFKNTPMILKKDGSLAKLEKQTSEIKHKAKAMGYGGTSTYLNFTDGASPVRLSTDAVFIIKVADAETDPETVFYVTKVIPHNKTREVDLVNISAFAGYGAGGKSTKKDQIKVEYEKISPGVYRVMPKDLARNTEYAFIPVAASTTGGNSVVFLFGTL